MGSGHNVHEYFLYQCNTNVLMCITVWLYYKTVVKENVSPKWCQFSVTIDKTHCLLIHCCCSPPNNTSRMMSKNLHRLGLKSLLFTVTMVAVLYFALPCIVFYDLNPYLLSCLGSSVGSVPS